MTLADWVKEAGRGAMSRLSQSTGVAYSTVHNAVKGQLIKQYDVAKKLSEATDGKVTIAELCEAQAAPAAPAATEERAAS
jgi:hypothetical protein